MDENQDIDESIRYEYLSHFIHYGSIVYLSIAENVEHRDLEENHEDVEGDRILHCDGFISKNLILHDLENSLEDFEGSLFRIIPFYSYDIQNKMNEDIRNFERTDKESSSYLMQDLFSNLEKELKANAERTNRFKGFPLNFGDVFQLEHVKSHKFLSIVPDQTNIGQNETFQVQFQDHPSQYTQFKILPAYKFQNEREKFITYGADIYISSAFDEGGRDTFLTYNPTTSRKMGEITSSLHIEHTPESFGGSGENKEEEDLLLIGAQRRDEFFMAFLKLTKFNIHLYRLVTQDPGKVAFGDIVWISQIERESFLEFDKSITSFFEIREPTVRTQTSLRRADTKNEHQNSKAFQDASNRGTQKHMEAIKEKARHIYFQQHTKKDMRSSVGMWKIEGEAITSGGLITPSSKVRIKNLSLGQYLCVGFNKIECGVESRKKNFILSLEKKRTNDGIFIFKNCFDSLNNTESGRGITSDSFFYFVHDKSDLCIALDLTSIKRGGNLNEKVVWRSKLKTNPTQEEMMRFIKALPHEVWEARFLLSCVPILRGSQKIIKMLNEEEDKEKSYNLTFNRRTGIETLKECLESVLNFCYYDPQLSSVSNMEIDYERKKPNFYRQLILREQGFLELLSSVIHECFPTQHCLEKIERVKERQKKSSFKEIIRSFTASKYISTRKSLWTTTKKNSGEKEDETISLFVEICQLSYKLISGICQENFENEIESFRYFHIFKMHIGFGLGATDCLRSVLKNNEKLLLLIHFSDDFNIDKYSNFLGSRQSRSNTGSRLLKPSIVLKTKTTLIHHFIQKYEDLMESHKQDYLYWLEIMDFLIEICKYKSNGITINQILIGDVLLKDSTTNRFMIPLDIHGKELKLGDKNDDKLREFKLQLSYLQKQLSIFNNLCFGRNYINMKKLKSQLTVPLLMKYIWDEEGRNDELYQEIRAIFVELLLNLHIDSKPRTVKIYPMYTKQLSTVKSKLTERKNDSLSDSVLQDETSKSQLHISALKSSTNKLHDVVVDITHIKNFTKAIKDDLELHKEAQQEESKDRNVEQAKESKEESNKSEGALNILFQMGRKKKENEGKKAELPVDFLKESSSSSVSKTKLVELMEKILEFLREHKKEGDNQNEQRRSKSNILALNIIILVKKMRKEVNQNSKLVFVKNQIKNDAARFKDMVKALVNILNYEPKEEEVEKEEIKKDNAAQKGYFSRIIGSVGSALGDFRSGMKDFRMTIGKLLADPDSVKKAKRRKEREDFQSQKSIEESYLIHGNGLKKKYMRMWEEGKADDLEKDGTLEVKIKHEIIEIFLFIMNVRHDSYIQSVIEFIQTNIQIWEKNNKSHLIDERSIENHIKTKLADHLPNIMDNGLKEKNGYSSSIGSNHLVFEDLQQMWGNNFIPLLLYLFVNSRDFSLNSLILELLFKCFKQRRTLLKSLKNLQILTKEDDQLLFSYINDKVTKLKYLCEQSELWLITPEKLESSSGIKHKYVIYQVKDMIRELIELLYDDGEKRDFSKNNNVMMEDSQHPDSEISRTRQDMMKNLGVQDIILTLLKDGSYVLESVNEKDEQNKSVVLIFESCYEFLLKFMKNDNKENKKSLYRDLDFFVQSLGFFEVGQTALISELFKDNYKLSLSISSDLLEAFYKKIAATQQGKGGHHPKYLVFFENIMFDKKEPIIENIEKIIAFIFDSNKRYEFLFMKNNPYYIEPEDERSPSRGSVPVMDIRYLWGHMIFNLESQGAGFEDVPYVYHSKALQILYYCLKYSEDRQLLRAICQKTLGLNYIFYLLNLDDVFTDNTDKAILMTILRLPLLQVLNEVWFVMGRPVSQLFDNKGIIKFINNQSKALKQLRVQEIETIKKTRRSTISFRKTLNFKKNNTILEEEDKEFKNDDYSFDSENSYEYPSEEEEPQDEDQISRKEMQSLLKRIVDRYRFEYVFDYIDILFRILLPLMNNLYKVYTQYVRSFENKEEEKDIEALSDFRESVCYFVKNTVSEDDLRRNKQNLYVLDDFEKYFSKTLEYSPQCAEWRNEESSRDKLQKLADEHPNKKELESLMKKGITFPTKEIKSEAKTKVELKPNHGSSKLNTDNSSSQLNLDDEDYYLTLPLSNILPKSFFDRSLNRENVWRVYILNMLTSKNVREKYIIPEVSALVNAIIKIDELEYPEEIKQSLKTKGKSINIETLLRKMVNFIKLALEVMDTEGDNLVVIDCLWLFKNILDATPEAEGEKNKLQNLMDKAEVSKTLLLYFCTPNISNRAFKIIVEVFISLLEGGNSEVQGTFYNFFLENPQSEHFFMKLASVMNEEIASLSRQHTLKEKINNSLKDFAYSYKTLDRFNVTKILKLLQLLTENHNFHIQNYFRYQTKSRNNFDILTITVNLLEALMRDLSDDNYHKIKTCFETLTEFIQGPCEQNQLALAEGNFIMIACNLLEQNDSIEEGKEKKKKRLKNLLMRLKKNKKESVYHKQATINKPQEDLLKYQEVIVKCLRALSKNYSRAIEKAFYKHIQEGFEPWMLSRLKYKCVITLESLLEGQTDNEMLRKIMKNLSIDVLKNNIGWIYEKISRLYDKKYTDKLFNNIDLDEKMPENKKKLTLITETGFKIFIILRKYLDLEKFEDDEEDLDVLKQELNQLFSTDNLVHQIGSLGIDLIKTGLGAVETIGKIAKISGVIKENEEYNEHEREDSVANTQKQKKNNKDGLSFFAKYTVSIEINRDNKIYRIYFPKLPHCLTIDQEIKNRMHENINRATIQTKISTFVQQSYDIIDTLKYEEKYIYDKNFLLSLLAKYVKLWKDLSFIVCIMQNVIILGITQNNHLIVLDSIAIGDEITPEQRLYYNMLLILEILQISLSMVVWIFFVSKRSPLLIKKANDYIDLLDQMNINQAEISKKQKKNFKQRILKLSNNFFIYLKFLALDYLLLYYLIYTTLAIFGMFHPIFIAILLLDVFIRYPLLLYVVKSLWRPKYQILLTIILFLIGQYYFTLVAFFVFYQGFEELCEDLWGCYSLIFDQTFKSNSGIGSFFQREKEGEKNNFFIYLNTHSNIIEYLGFKINARAVYDFLNYFIMNSLIVQIISGIIIDTFTVLRKEMEQKTNDMSNYCFICGIDRQTLDKKGDNKLGFTYHYKVEHNMWNYLFYISYLKDKTKTEYSGFESYIFEKLENDDITWFPLNSSLSLVHFDQKQSNRESKQVTSKLEEKVENLEREILEVERMVAIRSSDNYREKLQNEKI